jgi:autotransporter-associated beta strand protein
LGSTASGTRVYGRTGASLRLENGITVAEPITLVGQILPWINCLTAGGGSNTITGALYKEVDASIGTDGGSTLIIRGGVKHVSGGTLYIRHTGSLVFENKPIEFGTAAAVQVETSGTTVLAVPGNTFSTLKIANHAKVRTDVANALPSGCTLDIGGSWDADGLLNLNGHDQAVGSIKTDPRWSAPGYLAVTSAAPATLTVNQGGTTTYAGAFDGAVTLVKNNAGRITITNVTSTTTGDVILNGGSIVIAETAAFSACPTFKVNGGTLELRSSTALPDTATVRVLEGAKIAIKDGVTDTVDKLFLDGEQQAAGTWGATGSGAVHVNDTFFSGFGTLNVITGTQTAYTDAVWDGGGAGDDFSVAENWDGDALPSFAGFSRAVFATGGSTATADTPATFTKITFNAAADFTVAAGAGALTVGAGGIKAGAPAPTSSSRIFTITEDLVMGDHQFWSVTNNGTGTTYLRANGSISDGGNAFSLTKRGNGVLILAGDNSYGGVTTIETNYAIIRHSRAPPHQQQRLLGGDRRRQRGRVYLHGRVWHLYPLHREADHHQRLYLPHVRRVRDSRCGREYVHLHGGGRHRIADRCAQRLACQRVFEPRVVRFVEFGPEL